ncbi:MAG: DUF455 domain-containing protein, partial [Pseudomonadota bacterium]
MSDGSALAIDEEAGRADNRDLMHAAVGIVTEADLAQKVARAKAVAQAWHHRRLSLGHIARQSLPLVPGRPEKPELRPARDMPKR